MALLPSTNRDLQYDNAKLRRRSAIRVVVRALFSSGVRRRCCSSCGLGQLLALLMLMGLGYLAFLQPDQSGHTNNKSLLRNLGGYNGHRWMKDSPFLKKFWSTHRLPNLPPKLRLGLLRQVSSSGNSSNHQENEVKLPFIAERNSPEELVWIKRQAAVVDAFKHAWNGYKQFALGFDELQPVSRRGINGLGGIGATAIDALDTAMIMGLDDVVEEAGGWIEKELANRFSHQGQVNLFETTIRVLGGLLSAYHLSGGDTSVPGIDGSKNGVALSPGPKPEVYLKLAKDLGDRLMAAFETSPSAIPFSDVVLSARSAHPAAGERGASSTSEVTTLQLEFWYLSKVTGDPKYGKAAMRVFEHIKGLPKLEGLVPIYMNPHSGTFQGNNIRLGSRGDSYYEYLLKVWIQQGGVGDGQDVQYLRGMYDEAMAGVKHLLVAKSVPNGLTFVGELPSGRNEDFSPKMDHLVCFLAGNLALGATRGFPEKDAKESGFLSEKDVQDLALAKELARTCYEMYNVTITGLAPEIAYFRTEGDHTEGMDGGKPDAQYKEDIIIKPLDRHNLLRPETVESLFVLYRITGDSMYREWGWKIFQAFEAHTKISTGGYSSIDDVTVANSYKRDKMETFFLGETLKYLFLLFGEDDVLPLSYFVFNTEAHPLPITWEGANSVLS
ncbi:mannosyl-oligosaccharide 1,2-alpha-mannosidase MNS3 isoform X1 [Selaginella moellendorffii]|nr:mannosyl-oligosaccharide 1,2-alpha-mannosidase MNS3 isoform X1 [Selaginella moellendorffii]|eukprot:XP_024538904.1 mannosyl-oligosaccharide 1,2-alpha-mannosidase MNS3 isoform X1 [Selaginella moellendorffii]